MITKRQRKRQSQAIVPTSASETISSIADLLQHLPFFDTSAPIWFRGQTNHDWNLMPSLLRKNSPVMEISLLRRFKQVAHQNLNYTPADDWEWLFLMQHHGIPTRLLDWSESPLVALYFAVDSMKEPLVDGSLWILNPIMLNTFANITLYNAADIPAAGDPTLEAYSPASVQNLTQGTKRPAACIGPRRFARIRAQHGVFTVHHQDKTALDLVGEPPRRYLTKFRIPKESKESLRKELELVRVNIATIYMDLDAVSNQICKELNV